MPATKMLAGMARPYHFIIHYQTPKIMKLNFAQSFY